MTRIFYYRNTFPYFISQIAVSIRTEATFYWLKMYVKYVQVIIVHKNRTKSKYVQGVQNFKAFRINSVLCTRDTMFCVRNLRTYRILTYVGFQPIPQIEHPVPHSAYHPVLDCYSTWISKRFSKSTVNLENKSLLFTKSKFGLISTSNSRPKSQI